MPSTCYIPEQNEKILPLWKIIIQVEKGLSTKYRIVSNFCGICGLGIKRREKQVTFVVSVDSRERRNKCGE